MPMPTAGHRLMVGTNGAHDYSILKNISPYKLHETESCVDIAVE